MGPIFQLSWETENGRNPAPVDIINIPLFIGFHTSQVVVWDFSHQQYQIISKDLKEKTCLVGFRRGENHVASTPKLSFLLPKCRDGLIAEAEDYPCVKHSLETSVCESPSKNSKSTLQPFPLLPIWFTMLPVHLNDQFPDF